MSYEASPHIVVNEAAWGAGLGAGMGARATTLTTAYKKSATYTATHEYYIRQMAAVCPHLMMLFQYTGGNGQTGNQWWAFMDRTGNVTDQPYAISKALADEYNV